MNNPTAKFYALIDDFLNTFYVPTLVKYSYQYKYDNAKGEISYHPCKEPLTKEKWIEHFYSKAVREPKRVRGSLGVVPLMGKYLLWVAVDLDTAEQVKKAQPFMKKLKELGIDYLEEFGGDKLERRHIWIRVNASQDFAKEFFTRLLIHTYPEYKTKNDPYKDGEFDEFFGINKPSNLIRPFLGWHLKRNQRFPVEDYNTGNLIEDPAEAIELWLNMNPLTEDRMVEILPSFGEAPKEERKVPIDKEKRGDKFIYQPLNLPLPFDKMPRIVRKIASNCQAINEILHEVKADKMIEARGEVHHSAGLFLAGMAAYSDQVKNWRENVRSREGYNWFKELITKYRWRDESSHSWFNSFKTAEENYNRVFASCQKWDEKFDKCNGCPFKGKITSPKELYWGKYLEREVVEYQKLTTPEVVRNTTFKRFKEHVLELVDNGRREDILLSSFQGSGKSVCIDQLACDLVEQGKKVLIAVPSTVLAIEHKQRLEKCGTDAFILSSHKAIFTNGLGKVECPVFDEIQELIKLGITNKAIKDTFCAVCPLQDECYFPTQYKEAQEEKHKVIIIQHAHFSVPEIIFELMKKKFDVMFIDETFIDSCFSSVPLSDQETTYLELFEDNEWCVDLAAWLKGAESYGGLEPDSDSLSTVKAFFDSAGMPWRIPDLVRHYNRKRKVTPGIGIEVVYELPEIPIRVFTDATPPEELIKELTGIKNLVVMGKGEIMDYREIHPENRIIQVLDHSTSVTNLNDTSNFEDILMKIGELMELRFPNERALLTVYKKDFDRVETFFKLHKEELPTALSRLTIDRMDKGTNKYADYDIQFLLAGVYYTGNQYLLESYKYKQVSNYYRLKHGSPPIYNRRVESEEMISVGWESHPIERIEPYLTGGAKVCYTLLKSSYPKDSWHQLCQSYNIAKTQQAMRIRFTPDKPRYVYLLTDMFFPGFLITDSIFLSDFKKPLGEDSKLY